MLIWVCVWVDLVVSLLYLCSSFKQSCLEILNQRALWRRPLCFSLFFVVKVKLFVCPSRSDCGGKKMSVWPEFNSITSFWSQTFCLFSQKRYWTKKCHCDCLKDSDVYELSPTWPVEASTLFINSVKMLKEKLIGTDVDINSLFSDWIVKRKTVLSFGADPARDQWKNLPCLLTESNSWKKKTCKKTPTLLGLWDSLFCSCGWSVRRGGQTTAGH